MRLGIYVNAQHPAGDDPARRFAETVEQVRLIRALGFDSIWGGEHHATPGFHYFPLLPFLQRLAAEAEGLEVGTNLILLPLHNPVEVAEIGAFLDVITGGRFLLGVGLGYRPEEFALFRVPMAERVSRLVEGIEIIRRLWTEDGVTHRGRHWQLDAVTHPAPAAPAAPPADPRRLPGRGRDRAGRPDRRRLDGGAGLDGGRVRRPGGGLRDGAGRGRAPAEPPRLPPHRGGVRARTRRPRSAARRRTSWRSTRRTSPGGFPASRSTPARRPRRSSAAWPRTASPSGHPRRWSRRSSPSTGPGVTHATMRVSWPGMPQADVLAGLELLGRAVLPEVRRRTAVSP